MAWGKMLLAAGALGLMAGAAQAQMVDVTFSGVVEANMYDTDGLFGDAGGDLSGMHFVTTYRFNTSAGQVDIAPGSSIDVHGGASYGYPGVLNSASITINGHTFSVAGYDFSELYMRYDDHPQLWVEADNYVGEGVFNYLEPDGPANGWATGNFAGFDGDVSGQAGEGYVGSGNTYIFLINQHLSISAAPEPASWAMMLGGFGLVGGAMRSRRKAVVRFG